MTSSSSSSHLWACSGEGKVHVIQDITSLASSIRSNQVLHGHLEMAENWQSEIDGTFNKISCGYQGIVCAKKDKILYFRKGVTYDNPLGTSWAKGFCDVSDLAVGSEHIVRRTSNDELFVMNYGATDLSSSVFLPQWNAIPKCSDVDSHQLFTVDASDNLFLFSRSGDVFVIRDLSCSPEDYNWEKITGAPPMYKRRSGILNYLGWGDGGNDNMFSRVSAGDGCVWCACEGGRELYQLVIKTPGGKGGRRGERGVIEASWKQFKLPGKDEMTLLAADKTEIDVVYGSVQENKMVVSYAVLQDDSGRVEIPNPEDLAQRWRSLSICTTPKPNTPLTVPSLPNTNVQVPSIYPKLPPSEDFDICCETGECAFCRRAAEEASAIQARERMFVSREEEEVGGEGITAGKRKGRRKEGIPRAKKVKQSKGVQGSPNKGKRKERREREDEWLSPPAKKPRTVMSLQSLVADIPVRVVDDEVPLPPRLQVTWQPM